MARSATRAARREQEREERRQSQRALRPAGQTLAHNGAVYSIPPRLDPTACAIHEAGHCLVAHAVGMHVIYATVKREIVLPGGICRKRARSAPYASSHLAREAECVFAVDGGAT
jgi:hypothetical protein